MTGVTDVQRTAIAITLAAVLLAPAGAAGLASESGQPQPPQEEFVPIDQVPPEDQLPAAPLLITAYAIVWLVVFGYLWSIWRRLSAVERDLGELSRRAGSDERES
jgi:CcmD family protein